jgi:transposase
MNAYHNSVPIDDLVEQFSVSRSTVYSYIKQFRETGNIAPPVYRPGRKMKLSPYETEVRQVVAEHPDATLAEFCEKLSPHVSISTTTLCDFLRHLKITRKKRLSTLPNNIVKMSLKKEVDGVISNR